MYMHLSQINVELGKPVEKGDLIALSGNTGYSLGPHLHLSVRIYGYSIDPIKFLELMGLRISPREANKCALCNTHGGFQFSLSTF